MMDMITFGGNSLHYPFGVTITPLGFYVKVISKSDMLELLLYKRNIEKEWIRIAFPKESRMGDVWGMEVVVRRGANTKEDTAYKPYTKATLEGLLKDLEYAFESELGIFADIYGKCFSGRDSWGKAVTHANQLRCPLYIPAFDWEADRCLHRPLHEMILYRLHVRGFTKSDSSKVVHKGTFEGIIEKIDYLKELGINTLDLMPAQEFNEIIPKPAEYKAYVHTNKEEKLFTDKKVNFWGYTKAFHFAPKASFSTKKERNPVEEYKRLVKALHQAGIALVQEFYFDGSYSDSYILDVLRYWVSEFHIDGFHLTGYVPVEMLIHDSYLAKTMLIFDGVSMPDIQIDDIDRIGLIANDFLVDMRKFLKGDEGMLGIASVHIRNYVGKYWLLHAIADSKGFSLADMLSYDRKHNEANGENNRDGADINYSWNCGIEGDTKKKAILALRAKQYKNALLLLLLSLGTPIITAGDEFGQSRQGNNNAYCQDNEISWLNWKLVKKNAWQLAWCKQILAFRKKHAILRTQITASTSDGRMLPTVSLHGEQAWQAEFESFRRQLGILYYTKEEMLYVLYNMHWEVHTFALPIPKKGYSWHIAIDSGENMPGDFFIEGCEKKLEKQKEICLQPRSIVVLIAKKNI